MTLDEIGVGCIAFLDPRTLVEDGISCEIRGRHPFVCIDVRGPQSLWVALTSKPSFGWKTRTEIPSACKQGSPQWVETSCYVYDASYRWWLPNWLVQEASPMPTYQPQRLNEVTAEGVEIIRSVIRPLEP